MQRRTVLQQTKLAIRSIQYLTHPEEAAHRPGAGLFDNAVIDEKDKNDDGSKRQRGAPKQRGRGQERTHSPVVGDRVNHDRIKLT